MSNGNFAEITRRQFCRLSAASLPAIAFGGGFFAPSAPPKQNGKRDFDILIQGGTVIDPSQNFNAQLDVAIANGKIAAVAKDIPANQARKVISAAGKIVCPGLIDIHAHVYEGVGIQGLSPDRGWLAKGVTTVVDAGSAGYTTIAGLRKYIGSTSQTRVHALVDIGTLGLVAGISGTMENMAYVQPKETAEAVKSNKPFVVGVKVRLSKAVAGSQDMEGLRRTREAAEAAGVPMMVHIGDTYSPLRNILDQMRKGDVLTHCFHPEPHGLLDGSGKILPEVLEARQRGIFFDIGHGSGHFGFDVAEQCLQQGFLPDTISSDLTTRTAAGPVFDFLTTLSKFFCLGLRVDDVIQMATSNAARAFDFGLPLGTLRPGSEADVAILELRDGSFAFTDSLRKDRTARQKLFPVQTIRAGKLFESPRG